jgi:hypothetical protein
VPVFQHYLTQLTGLVRKAQAHVNMQDLPEAAILDARLAPDMLPFSLQVEIAANFARRACAPLAGLDVPAYGAKTESFAWLLAHIADTQAFLAGLTPAQMADADTRTHHSQAGEALVSLKGHEFLLHYALPNFFFHLSSAYAILRQQGLAIGKADFDGFHQYSPSR